MAEPELSKWEYWVLKVYFEAHGFFGPHEINEIRAQLSMLGFSDTNTILQSLVEKKVLSLSPDKRQVRITDYGAEFYHAIERAQGEWESQKIIRVATLDRDEQVIRAGERFRANHILREIFESAREQLSLLDPYIGPSLFDMLEEVAPRLLIRILTSDKIRPIAISTYQAFRGQYPRTELRISTEDKLHDRFILWDGSHGVTLGHSIKDLGEKDTQITVLKTTGEQYRLFEERWSEAQIVEVE